MTREKYVIPTQLTNSWKQLHHHQVALHLYMCTARTTSH